MTTTKTELLPDGNLNILSDIEISKDDIVNVAVVEYEDRLKGVEKAAQEELRLLTKKVSAATEKHDADLSRYRQACLKKVEKAVKPLLDKAGFDKYKIRLDTVEPKEEAGNSRSFSASMIAGREGYPVPMKPVYTYAVPAYVEKAAKALNDANAEFATCRNKLTEIRRVLNDLPNYQRRVGASITRQALKESGKGKLLLEALSRVEVETKLLES